uniref:BPTI/Kunitz inhibitor domain-containing protein n=1 Tax=Photinus pyralis TaxID=7054 RepID=A0A1Y1K156_PHOPY
MKTVTIVLACLIGTFYSIQATPECNELSSVNIPFNCGEYGEPHFYEENGECRYACLDNGKKKSCPQMHRLQFMEWYIRSRCRLQVFDCGNKGEEHLVENDDDDTCSYGCKSGDMVYTCEQVHPYHKK